MSKSEQGVGSIVGAQCARTGGPEATDVGREIAEPKPERRYSLDDLLSDWPSGTSEAAEDWMNSPPVGRELL